MSHSAVPLYGPTVSKVAYLILVHHQVAHFSRLVRMLNCEWAHFFVHVDKAADLAAFKKAVPESHNVSYLTGNRRIKVFWGGYSMIQATLNLLESAVDSGCSFKRYCLLSGSDFPVKKIEHIRNSFSSDKEFIRIDRGINASQPDFIFKYVARYHFIDNYLLNLKTAPFQGLHQLSNRLLDVIPKRLYAKIPLYHGSQWWSLTDQCIKYVLDFVRNNQDYVSFHKHSLLPDEIFFHSIVRSSPFAHKITHDFERVASLEEYAASNEYGCHYIDWQTLGEVPKVLDLTDLNALLATSALFARKFQEQQSAPLISRLEKLILQQ